MKNVFLKGKIVTKVRIGILIFSALFSCYSFSQENEVEISRVTVKAIRDPEWSSYRDIYNFNLKFESYDGAKDLIEIYYLLQPKKSEVNMFDLKLTLIGKSTNIDMPVDIYGRAKIPISDIAYNEDAQMIANRGKGSFQFRKLIQIKPTLTGVYLISDLKEACEQNRKFYIFAKGILSVDSIKMRHRKCSGIEFASLQDRGIAPEIYFENHLGDRSLLIAKNNRTVYLFKDWPLQGKLISINPQVLVSIVTEAD